MAIKLTLLDISSGFKGTDINTNFTSIEDEFDKVVYRDGTSPNQLTDNLDLNSNKIVNLGAPVNNSDAMRLQDVTDDGKTAKATAVTIDDTGAEYTSDNVEGALAELGGLNAITDAESTQLQNIDSVTITNTQWGYLGAADQGVSTTDAVTFTTVDTGQGANELYAMDQDVETTDGVTFDSVSGLATLGLVEQSADPSDPATGGSVLWQSDGTGTGDDGDILMKITDSNGTTKTATIVDYSTV